MADQALTRRQAEAGLHDLEAREGYSGNLCAVQARYWRADKLIDPNAGPDA